LIDGRAWGNFAAYQSEIATVQVGERGTAMHVLDTDSSDPPGRYTIHTIPTGGTNGVISSEGAQFCMVQPGTEPGCSFPEQPIGPGELVEPMIRQAIRKAGETWATVGANATTPLSDLACNYEGTALAARQQELQTWRAQGNRLEARLTRPVEIQMLAEAQPGALNGGVEVVVEERWNARLHHSDGSSERLQPNRQTWRYVLVRGEIQFTASNPACGTGLRISQAQRLS
jgi:hypothetical protein